MTSAVRHDPTAPLWAGFGVVGLLIGFALWWIFLIVGVQQLFVPNKRDY